MRLYKIIRFLIKRKLYFAIRNSRPVWLYVLNRKGRAVYKKSHTKLGAPEKRVVADLKKSGIALASLEEFFSGENILDSLRKYSEPLKAEAEIKNKKSFLKFLFDLIPVLDFENPFVKLALDEKILGIAAQYYGFAPKFRGFTLNMTTPVTGQPPPVDSQRWHRDPEDKIVVKMFLYLNDVNEEGGPFIYIKGSHHLGRYKNLFPTAPPAGSYPDANEVAKAIDSKDIIINTARAGTLIFCETSGLHKGGYATKNERLMFTSIYTSSAATSPKIYKARSDFNLRDFREKPLVYFALDN